MISLILSFVQCHIQDLMRQYISFSALARVHCLEKSDLKHVFQLIPVAKADFPLLGFKFDGYYFFDRSLLAVAFYVPCLSVLPYFYSLLFANL